MTIETEIIAGCVSAIRKRAAAQAAAARAGTFEIDKHPGVFARTGAAAIAKRMAEVFDALADEVEVESMTTAVEQRTAKIVAAVGRWNTWIDRPHPGDDASQLASDLRDLAALAGFEVRFSESWVTDEKPKPDWSRYVVATFGAPGERTAFA